MSYPTSKYYQSKKKPGEKREHPTREQMEKLGMTAKKAAKNKGKKK